MSVDPKRLNHYAAVAILGSLVDSGLDAIASMVTVISVRQAAQPPDRAHRYGHGKAEAIGAFVQAGFVLGSALFLAGEAVRRLISPQPIEQTRLGIAVLLLAILLTAALLGLQRFVVRRTGSIAIQADSVHYRSDLLLYSAFGVARHALDMLMDRELPAEQRAYIRRLALEHPGAHNVHDLRTRRAGADVFIELHLELGGELSLEQAHDIAHEVEERIRAAYPAADIIVHQEPAGLADARLDAQIAAAER